MSRGAAGLNNRKAVSCFDSLTQEQTSMKGTSGDRKWLPSFPAMLLLLLRKPPHESGADIEKYEIRPAPRRAGRFLQVFHSWRRVYTMARLFVIPFVP